MWLPSILVATVISCYPIHVVGFENARRPLRLVSSRSALEVRTHLHNGGSPARTFPLHMHEQQERARLELDRKPTENDAEDKSGIPLTNGEVMYAGEKDMVKASETAVHQLHLSNSINILWLLLFQLVMFLVFICILGCLRTNQAVSHANYAWKRLHEDDSAADAARGHHVEHAQMLGYISIDADGGLDRIRTEFFQQAPYLRRAKLLLMLGGGLANMIVLSVVSVFILTGFVRFVQGESLENNPVMKHWELVPSEMRHILLLFAAVIAFSELVMITMLSAKMVTKFLVWKLSNDSFCRYDAVRLALWEILPELATFSALKALRYCHPNLIVAMFNDHWRDPTFGPSLPSKIVQALYFVLSRICAGLLGSLAFAVKVLEVATVFKHTESWIVTRWMYMFSFLFQVMFILLLDQQFTDRVFRLFFSGKDTKLSVWEGDYMHAYQVRIVQEIIRIPQYNWFDTLCLLVSFDHRDLQRLLIEEDDGQKQKWVNKCRRLPHSDTQIG